MQPAHAQANADLAGRLADPIAQVGNLRLQYDYDRAPGPQRSLSQETFVALGAWPIRLSEDWTMVARAFWPAFRQRDARTDSIESGVGDLFPAFFLSPARSQDDINWGVGAAFQLRTSSSERFANEKWGGGPTAAVTRREGAWTWGILADHLWSFGGDPNRPDYSQTFLQPMVHYTTRDAWTFSVTSEAVYNWKGNQWSLPAIFSAAKVVPLRDMQVQFGAGLRYWVKSPLGGPDNWGLRMFVTFVTPE